MSDLASGHRFPQPCEREKNPKPYMHPTSPDFYFSVVPRTDAAAAPDAHGEAEAAAIDATGGVGLGV